MNLKDAFLYLIKTINSIQDMVKIIQCWIIGLDKRKYHASDKSNAVIEGYDNIPRQKQNHVDGNKSKETFRDLRGTFAEEQVKKET